MLNIFVKIMNSVTFLIFLILYLHRSLCWSKQSSWSEITSAIQSYVKRKKHRSTQWVYCGHEQLRNTSGKLFCSNHSRKRSQILQLLLFFLLFWVCVALKIYNFDELHCQGFILIVGWKHKLKSLFSEFHCENIRLSGTNLPIPIFLNCAAALNHD